MNEFFCFPEAADTAGGDAEGDGSRLSVGRRRGTGEHSQDREDVLVSPAISPVPWARDVPSGVGLRRTAMNTSDSSSPLQISSGRQCVTLQVPSFRFPIKRHGSSASLTSDNEDQETEPTKENLHRRGRRAAIYNSKNFIGDAKSPDRSPNESGGEDNEEDGKRRRSSLELSVEVLPRVDILKEKSKKILKKQNTVADLTQKTLQSFATFDENSKKRGSGMSILKLIDKKRNKGRDSGAELHDILAALKPSEFRDTYLMSFKNLHWKDLFDKPDLESEAACAARSKEASSSPSRVDSRFADLPEKERLRREAVWELFKSELVFLIDYLMVLKHCFLEPLKKLQVDGHLMFVEPEDLFGNIDELCYVSYTFSRDLISTLCKEAKRGQFGTTSGLLKAFKRWSLSSKDGEVFHNYCLNYHCAITYLEILRRQEQFSEFEKRCEVDPRCHRLQITDLLVAPMQHCTKMPLLLAQIRKYTSEDCNKAMLTESLKRVENSLKSLEDKLKWLRNFERLQNIQQQLIWPPITELETKAFIPDFLKSSLSCQPCEKLIANPKRQLIHEGLLSLVETNRSTEVYCFLFDDILLLTKVKKPPKKRSVNESSSVYSMSPTDGALFVVYRQPIALDRFSIHDIGYVEANANGLKHAFVLIHISRFQQIIGVYTLQSAGDQQKLAWLDSLRQSQQRFQEKLKCKLAMTVAANSPRTNTHRRLMSKMQRMQMREQQRQRHQQQQQPARRRSGGSGKDVPISASASKAGIESSNCEDINEEDENEDDAKTDLLDDDDDDDYEDDDDADDATGDDVDEDEGDDESDGAAALSTEDVVRHRKHRQRLSLSPATAATSRGESARAKRRTASLMTVGAAAGSGISGSSIGQHRRRPGQAAKQQQKQLAASDRILEAIEDDDADLSYIVKVNAPFSPPLSPTLHTMEGVSVVIDPGVGSIGKRGQRINRPLSPRQQQQQPQGPNQYQQLQLPNKFLDMNMSSPSRSKQPIKQRVQQQEQQQRQSLSPDLATKDRAGKADSCCSGKHLLTLDIEQLRPRSSSDVREIDMSPDDSESPVGASHQERSASVGVINSELGIGRQLSIIDEDQLDLPSAVATALKEQQQQQRKRVD
ncbi:hypothetical protein BOX15_Mlig031346g2 [Macrostomum lignano]|uniref:DH domain-containing protein n=1 Tax=Macrostomum lignano TaxID=282301 RepID=A0A267GES2_9PLAT|nr:hypothetical protein BOX15_Mlig031346g2 [Macrostomum lignano]